MRLILLRILLGLGICAWPLAWTAKGAPASEIALTLEPVGYSVYPIPSRGVEVTYVHDSHQAFSLSYARGSFEQLLAEHDSEVALLRYRLGGWALSHVQFGFGYRRQSYLRSLTSNGQAVTADVAATVAVLELGVGSRLNLGPLIVGCDWLGLLLPVRRISGRDDYPPDVEGEEQRAYEDASRKVVKAPSLELMRLAIGVIF